MIYEPIWGAIIAWYLFLAGLGGGAFATAVFVRYRHPDCKRLMRVGRLIAPIVVIIGLCLLCSTLPRALLIRCASRFCLRTSDR